MLSLPAPTWLCAVSALLAAWTTTAQQVDKQLTGTWTTKSRKVLTGPGFYDPVNERMFEPDLTGFSYSFTDDGFYEEAYYRAISNPTDPSCPKGIIQWQHGSYVLNSNGSLTLTPISVDGRQLLSDPCNYANSIYTRYNQTELFKTYSVGIDDYSKAQRLNLFAFDGSPLNPMYLAYQPPQMLPTQTLNPTSSSKGSQPTSTGSGKLKKRFHGGDEHVVDDEGPLDGHIRLVPKKQRPAGGLFESYDADKIWWIGVGMTALGGIGYFCF